MKIRISKKEIGVTEVLWFLLAVFLIMKEMRAFSGADTMGGLWNIIQLGFMAVGFYYLLRKPGLLNNRAILWLLLYSVLAGLIIAVPQFLCMLGFEAMDKFSIGKYLAFLPVFNEIDGNVKLCYIVFSVIIVLAVCLYGNIIKNCTRE